MAVDAVVSDNESSKYNVKYKERESVKADSLFEFPGLYVFLTGKELRC